VGPRAGLEAVTKRKKFHHWSCRELSPGRPARSPVSVLTELPRLHSIWFISEIRIKAPVSMLGKESGCPDDSSCRWGVVIGPSSKILGQFLTPQHNSIRVKSNYSFIVMLSRDIIQHMYMKTSLNRH